MRRTADLIHMHRAIKRITLDDLSKLVGKSTSMLSAIERDNKNGSIGLLKKICNVLEIPKERMLRAIINDTKDDISKLWESIK